MKRFILFFFAVLLSLNVHHSDSCDFNIIHELELGSQPMRVLYDDPRNEYHVFCNGMDVNYNGIYEEDQGDEKPSWWIVTLSETNEVDYEKVRDFELGYFTPTVLLNCLDQSTRKLYVPFAPTYDEDFNIVDQGKVAIYDLDDHSLIDEEFLSINPTSISFYGNVLFITGQNDDLENKVYAYDRFSHEFLDEMNAGVHVQQVAAHFHHAAHLSVAILNEGHFGQNNSTLMMCDFKYKKFGDPQIIELGDTGHTILAREDDFVVTMNGSHKILFINEKNIEREVEISTSGYNGPRETVFYGNLMIVSTYAGNIYLYEKVDDKYYLYDQVEINTNIESLLLNRGFLFATSPLDASYNTLKKVYILRDQWNSVDDDIGSLMIYPNPANTVLNLTIKSDDHTGYAQIDIFSARGELIFYDEINLNNDMNKQIDISGFSQGSYYLKLSYGSKMEVINFSVIR